MLGRTVTVIVDVWAGPPLSWLMVLEGPEQAIDEVLFGKAFTVIAFG